MKTTNEWLKEFLSKEDYKKAVKYIQPNWETVLLPNFHEALSTAFYWEESDEKFDYWYNVNHQVTDLIEFGFYDNIVDEVRTDLLNRSQTGIKKYGTTMDRNDLSLIEWHQHQYEELLDAAVYTKKIINQLKTNQ